MSNKEKRFFNIAKEVSHLSDFKKARVGAVVVEGNRVISTGFSSTKTSTVQHHYNKYRHFDKNDKYTPPSLHAEIMALAPLMDKDIDWRKVSIYTYREWKDGTISCSRPCEACTQLIRELGIKNIYYTDWDGSFIKEKVLEV